MSSIMAKQTAAAQADFIVDLSHYNAPCSITSNGLTGAETVAILVSDDGGATYAALFDYLTGLAVVLDATHNQTLIVAPGLYRVAKVLTAATVGVSISTSANA